MEKGQIKSLAETIEPTLKRHNVYLYDLDYVTENGSNYLRILIEKSDGSMDLDTCVDVSNELSIVLDNIAYLNEEYILEVSSPGAERPLKDDLQFSKAINKYIYVKLNSPVEGFIELKGNLLSVDETSITLGLLIKTRTKQVVIERKNIQVAMTTVKI